MADPSVIAISMIVLVGLVAAVAVTINNSDSENKSGNVEVRTSTKAVLCESAEYKASCQHTLGTSNSSDPKELIKIGLEAVMKDTHHAIRQSHILKEEAKDNMTRQACEICAEVLSSSIDSLNKAHHHVGKYDPTKNREYLEDLRVWVSGVLADHMVCKDGFTNTTGDTGEKMSKHLVRSRELTINGLCMIDQMSKILHSHSVDTESDSLQGAGAGRRLLSLVPDWVDANRRRLLTVSIKHMKTSVVVAKDGSGKYKTVNEALKDIPKNNQQAFVIHIKEGVYEEQVKLTKHMTNVVLFGDGPTKTRIAGNLNYAGGVQTFMTSTVSIMADDFIAKDMAFENTAGPEGHQAVALRVQGDKAVFVNCHMDGYQDTLYAQKFRQFYRACAVRGTVDFIFGAASAVFQKCHMEVKKPGPEQKCMVTAQGRTERQEKSGIVLHDCKITPEPGLKAVHKEFHVYLGRPWKAYATTVIIQSEIGGFIDPEGWAPWPGTSNMDTCYYAEYGNRGKGAGTENRVKWKGVHKIDGATAEAFTPGKFFLGGKWIPHTGVAYFNGWMDV